MLGRTSIRTPLTTIVVLVACAALLPATAAAFGPPFLERFHAVSTIGSAEPENKDENPYGIVTVPSSVGSLVRGDILISNFNNSKNKQGTGTTLVQLTPSGHLTLFAKIDPAALHGESCPGGLGLTTALAILPSGDVVVGSLPAENGEAANAKAGCLIVLSSAGSVLRTIAGDQINGPWDMTAISAGPFTDLFVTNVLNETVKNGETPTEKGTVVRITLFTPFGHAPIVLSEQVIATGFPERTSESALVVGPTGDTLGPFGTLYVADTQGNRIAAIPGALFRQTAVGHGGITVTEGGKLSGPLGMTLAPNGDLLTANGGNGELVETTPFGAQVASFDTGAGEGGLFGLTVAPNQQGVYFVNDSNNTLGLLH